MLESAASETRGPEKLLRATLKDCRFAIHGDVVVAGRSGRRPRKLLPADACELSAGPVMNTSDNRPGPGGHDEGITCAV